MKSNAWIPSIQDGKWDTYFQKLYGADAVPAQRQRYVRAIRQFVQTYSGGIFCLHRSGCRGQRKADGKYTSGMVESLFPGKIHMDRSL